MKSLLDICLRILAQNPRYIHYNLLPDELVGLLQHQILFEQLGGKVSARLTSLRVLKNILLFYDISGIELVDDGIDVSSEKSLDIYNDPDYCELYTPIEDFIKLIKGKRYVIRNGRRFSIHKLTYDYYKCDMNIIKLFNASADESIDLVTKNTENTLIIIDETNYRSEVIEIFDQLPEYVSMRLYLPCRYLSLYN